MSLINNTAHDYFDKFMVAYLDDILFYGHTRSEHITYIKRALQRLHENRLYAKFSKFIYGTKEKEYFGFYNYIIML